MPATMAGPGMDRTFPDHVYGGRAQVAQLVEHATENRGVGGSIPPLGTIPRPFGLDRPSGRPRSPPRRRPEVRAGGIRCRADRWNGRAVPVGGRSRFRAAAVDAPGASADEGCGIPPGDRMREPRTCSLKSGGREKTFRGMSEGAGRGQAAARPGRFVPEGSRWRDGRSGRVAAGWTTDGAGSGRGAGDDGKTVSRCMARGSDGLHRNR